MVKQCRDFAYAWQERISKVLGGGIRVNSRDTEFEVQKRRQSLGWSVQLIFQLKFLIKLILCHRCVCLHPVAFAKTICIRWLTFAHTNVAKRSHAWCCNDAFIRHFLLRTQRMHGANVCDFRVTCAAYVSTVRTLCLCITRLCTSPLNECTSDTRDTVVQHLNVLLLSYGTNVTVQNFVYMVWVEIARNSFKSSLSFFSKHLNKFTITVNKFSVTLNLFSVVLNLFKNVWYGLKKRYSSPSIDRGVHALKCSFWTIRV